MKPSMVSRRNAQAGLVLRISMTYVIERLGIHALHGQVCICADLT